MHALAVKHRSLAVFDEDVQVFGHGDLQENLPRIRLEVHMVMEKAPVEPRSRWAIFDLWEPGVDGMMFRQRLPKEGEKLDEKFSYAAGSELVTHSVRSADEFLAGTVQKFGWRDRRAMSANLLSRAFHCNTISTELQELCNNCILWPVHGDFFYPNVYL